MSGVEDMVKELEWPIFPWGGEGQVRPFGDLRRNWSGPYILEMERTEQWPSEESLTRN